MKPKKPEHCYITVRMLKDAYKELVKKANAEGKKPSTYAREILLGKST